MSRRERLLAASGVVAVCVVLMDQLVLGPWLRHTTKVGQEIHRLEEGIRTYHQLLTRAPQINAEVDLYKEFVRNEAEPEPDMAALLREVELLGGQSGVSLGEVKPLEGSSNALYREYAVDVQYRASMEQAVHFLYLLQSSKLLFSIQKAAVEKSNDDPSVLQGSIRLTSKVIHGRGASPAAEPATAEKKG